jgi:hypothetical protein
MWCFELKQFGTGRTGRRRNDVRVSENEMLRRILGPKRDGGCRRGRNKTCSISFMLRKS